MSAIYPGGVPLVGYLRHRNVLIAIACSNCGMRSLLPPRIVIRKLEAAGRGDGNTGVIALARDGRHTYESFSARLTRRQHTRAQRIRRTNRERRLRFEAGVLLMITLLSFLVPLLSWLLRTLR